MMNPVYNILLFSMLVYFATCVTKMDSSKCYISVNSSSGQHLADVLQMKKGMQAFLHLQFPKETHVTWNKTIMNPYAWMWTFVPPDGAFFFISWPVEYKVYSFGLLSAHSLEYPVNINLQVKPKQCPIVLGETSTVRKISKALQVMAKQHLYNISNLYEYSYWCFTTEFENMNDTLKYILATYFGIPYAMFGYDCCKNYVSNVYPDKVECHYPKRRVFEKFTMIPFCLGILLFTYFPLLWLKANMRAMESGKEICTHERAHYYAINEHEDDDWLFLKRRSPITIMNICLGICGLGRRHPLITSRLRRIIFTLFSPIVVYTDIVLFWKYYPDMATEVAKHKIPFGFRSILAGYEESRTMFLPMFGGPLIAILLYFAAALIILLIPRDEGQVLEMGLPIYENTNISTILNLDIKTIELFSKKSCMKYKGYKKMFRVFRSCIYMLVNPSFWKFIPSFFANRWAMLAPVNKISRAFCVLPYIILCFFEFCIALCYYGLPFILVSITAGRGYIRYFESRFRNRSIFIRLATYTFFPLAVFYFIYMLSVIVLESFKFIADVMIFTYLAVVIFPHYSFGFFYFVLMFLFYVNRIVSNMESDYLDLFHHAIKACIRLEERRHVRVDMANEKIVITSHESHDPRHIRADIVDDIRNNPEENAVLFELKFEQISKLLRYKGEIPGIRRETYDHVVRRFRPVHIAVFHVLVQVFLVAILVLATLIFITKYIKNIDSFESDEIMHVITAVVVTFIPGLIQKFFETRSSKKVRKRKVREAIRNYVKENFEPFEQRDDVERIGNIN